MRLHPHVGVVQNVHPLSIRRHDPVLDSVVNHFHEVTRAVRSAMQITVLRGAALHFLAARGARGGIDRRRERGKNRIEMLHDLRLAADHLAKATLESPDATAGA